MYTDLDLKDLRMEPGDQPTLSLSKTLSMDGEDEAWFRSIYARYRASKPSFGIEVDQTGPRVKFDRGGSVLTCGEATLLFLRPSGRAFCGEILSPSSYRIYPVLLETGAGTSSARSEESSVFPNMVGIQTLTHEVPVLVRTLRDHAAKADAVPPILLYPQGSPPFEDLFREYLAWLWVQEPEIRDLTFDVKNIRLDQVNPKLRINTGFLKPGVHAATKQDEERIGNLVKSSRTLLNRLITEDTPKGLTLLGIRPVQGNPEYYSIDLPSKFSRSDWRFWAHTSDLKLSAHEKLALVEKFGPFRGP